MFKVVSLKEKLRKVTSFLLMYSLIITAVTPLTSVYAGGMSVITEKTSYGQGTISGNNDTAGSGSGNGYDTSNNIGKMWGEGVRCYIYNKKSNEFIQTQDGYDAIDFLGANGGVQLASLVSQDNISKETAFGEASNIKSSSAYPFEINGNIKYWVHIGFNATSDLTEINNWLLDNHASNLGLIVDKYWGTQQLQRLRRDENLLFCVEPLQIVPSVDDDGDQESEAEIWTKSVPNHHTTYKYGSVYDDDDTLIKDIEQIKEEDKPDYLDNNIMKHHSYRYIEKGTQEYNDLVQAFVQNNTSEDSIKFEETNSDFKSWYVEEITWDTTDTYSYKQKYKYIYGTTRWLFDNSELEEKTVYPDKDDTSYSAQITVSKLGVPTYYNVPNWSNNAVYCKGIGKNSEYNKQYPNICFSNGELINDPTDENNALHPAFEGELNITRKGDGRITTYGLALYAPACDASIWHTNDYKTDRPSGVPTEDRPNYPNDAYQYGNNIVEKIYEIRDKETDEIKATTSVITTGIGDKIS